MFRVFRELGDIHKILVGEYSTMAAVNTACRFNANRFGHGMFYVYNVITHQGENRYF